MLGLPAGAGSFALDCCDREVMAWVATTAAITGEMVCDLMAESVEARFGAAARRTPHPVQWLSDNGPPYTANETREFGEAVGLVVCTTPVYSPESNGMAEAFVKPFRRDYVYLSRLDTAEEVMRALASWFDRGDDAGQMGPMAASDDAKTTISTIRTRVSTCSPREPSAFKPQPADYARFGGATPNGLPYPSATPTIALRALKR